ncbi:hypothetical protein EsH8_XIV_000034 [Colletotrichum jinshuiense]
MHRQALASAIDEEDGHDKALDDGRLAKAVANFIEQYDSIAPRTTSAENPRPKAAAAFHATLLSIRMSSDSALLSWDLAREEAPDQMSSANRHRLVWYKYALCEVFLLTLHYAVTKFRRILDEE